MNKDNWFNKYFEKNIFENNNYDDYILLLKKKTSNNNEIDIKEKISNIESNYKKQLEKLKQTFNINSINNEISKLTKLEILQKELQIIKLLSKYTLQNNILDYDIFINSLEILLVLSNNLRLHLKQPILNHDVVGCENISRCSYKFCKFKDSCTYNYVKTNQICYQDHYVHNMVCADLNILLKVSKKNNKDSTIVHNKEILKSINTLCYVIGHMENELRTKCFYQEKINWDKFHISKKIINKIIKR
jgi:hypothetical protein